MQEEKKVEEKFEDTISLHHAYQKVFDLNGIAHHKEDEVLESSKTIDKAFREIKFPINHNQLATAMVLAVLLKDESRLLCQIGAGRGKSRVAAALAFYYLATTRKQVYLVYPDEGLMRRDQEQCQHLWAFAGYVHRKEMARLHH